MSNRDLSRAISHALRHEPWLYELELDDDGWVPVTDLISALRQQGSEWSSLDPSDIEAMIATSEKQRHELADGRVRALYGHSLPGKLRRVHAEPPDLLFHGTAPSVAAVILREGIRPMTRQYVHLSVDEETAKAVGRRKAAHPVVLRISASAANQAGVKFYIGNEKVWLADFVPATFIQAPST